MSVCFHDVQTDIYFNLPTYVSIRVQLVTYLSYQKVILKGVTEEK